jgi:hypothetical protein
MSVCYDGLTLYAESDHTIEIPALTNGATGEVVSGADVVVTLYRSKTQEVAGQVWPTQMVEDVGQPGRYYATLSAELDLLFGQVLLAKVVATDSAFRKRTWQVSLIVKQ